MVPENVGPAEAAVATDAVTTAYHAIHRRAEVKKDETVFLFGLGGLGFNALQIILNIGARVIVSEIRQTLLDEAAALGVPTADIVTPGHSVQDFVKKSGLPGKIDTVLDFVGTHQTFADAEQIGTWGLRKSSALSFLWHRLTRRLQSAVEGRFCASAVWIQKTQYI